MASLSPLLPNPEVVPYAHLQLEVLRRPLDSAQYTSIAYTERLDEAGIAPSVGSVGDSYDNALAESVIGLYKTEVIRRRTRWKGIDDVEFSTLEWVDWFNHQRLLEPIGYVPPAEFEAAYWRELEPATDTQTPAEVADRAGSRSTSDVNVAPRRSEGLVSGADGRSEGSGDGPGPWVVSEARHGEVRREVGAYRPNDGIQAPESP